MVAYWSTVVFLVALITLAAGAVYGGSRIIVPLVWQALWCSTQAGRIVAVAVLLVATLVVSGYLTAIAQPRGW